MVFFRCPTVRMVYLLWQGSFQLIREIRRYVLDMVGVEAAFFYNVRMSETKTVRLTETVKAAG